MIKELENKIGQLQYEISLLEHSEEELTGVTIRTDELKDLVKKLNIPVVSNQRKLLIAFQENFYKGIHDVTRKDIEFGVDKYLSNL